NVSDDYEFFQANTLGGSSNLRGLRRDRFSGKTAFYQNNDLRFRLSTYNGYIFRGEYGIFGFFDHGRVWMPDEDSDTWHYGYGGGIWFFLYDKIPVTATYAASKEDPVITIKAGFLF